MKISKRNKIIFGVGMLLIVIVLIASSFAYWQLVRTQTDENLLGSGCFDITFTEESSAINLEDAYPISDEEGMDTDPYTFKIKNTCEMYASYQVNLEVIETSTLLSKNVKVVLDNNTSKKLTGYESVSPTIDNANESYKLITGKLDPEQEITYDLRMWMDKDTSIEEGSNKIFKSKITIIAVPIEAPSGLEILGNIKFIINSNQVISAEAFGKTKGKNVTWSYTSSDGGEIVFNSPNELSTVVNTTTAGSGIITITAADGNSASIEVTFSKDSGIFTANQLYQIRNNLSGKYVLMNDIDISECSATSDEYGAVGDSECGTNWLPIGTNTTYFTGSLDGGNYTISNLKINRSSTDFVGLFGKTTVILKNIILDKVDIKGNNYVGGLVGLEYGAVGTPSSALITNVHIIGKVECTGDYCGGLSGMAYSNSIYNSFRGIVAGSSNTGGLIGQYSGDILSNSYTIAEVSGNNYVGGLVGHTYSNFANQKEISRSYSIGTVNGNQHVGGLIGQSFSYNSSSSRIISDCFSTSNASGVSHVGGLTGSTSFYYSTAIITIKNTYTIGKVAGTSDVGGLIGNIQSGATIHTTASNYFNKETSMQTTSMGTGVLGMTTAEMTTLPYSGVYTGYDFDTVWQISPVFGYPILRGLPDPYSP